MSVVPVDIFLDLSNQLFDAPEGPTSNGLLGNDIEPDLDLIQPRDVGWGVVDVPSFMGCQPALNTRVFVGGIVVYHHVDFKFLGNVFLDMLQELKILLMPVPLLALGEHFAIGDV